MTLFGLVRHGQTDYNLRDLFQGSSDIPLNDTGRDQAHHALDDAPPIPWDLAVSSPLIRARETARIIAADHGIPLGPTDDRLREIDWGAAEGRDVHEMEQRYPGRSFPGREDHQQVLDRGLAALADLATAHPDENLLVVAHGTVIRFVLSGILGRRLGSIPNGALSLLETEGADWTVRMVGGAEEHVRAAADTAHGASPFTLDTSHLRPLGLVTRENNAMTAPDPKETR